MNNSLYINNNYDIHIFDVPPIEEFIVINSYNELINTNGGVEYTFTARKADFTGATLVFGELNVE